MPQHRSEPRSEPRRRWLVEACEIRQHGVDRRRSRCRALRASQTEIDPVEAKLSPMTGIVVVGAHPVQQVDVLGEVAEAPGEALASDARRLARWWRAGATRDEDGDLARLRQPGLERDRREAELFDEVAEQPIAEG